MPDTFSVVKPIFYYPFINGTDAYDIVLSGWSRLVSCKDQLFFVSTCEFCLFHAVNGLDLDDVIKPSASVTDVEDQLVMETKLTIIEILKVLSFFCFVHLLSSFICTE